MERLTEMHYKKSDGYYIRCSERCDKDICDCECEKFCQIVEALGAIEDILGDNYDLDRLRELVEADREGRCVVLPCKIEDDVYINLLGKTLPFSVISISQMASTPTHKAMHGVRLCYIFKADDVGKTVFRTREAAEQALREE